MPQQSCGAGQAICPPQEENRRLGRSPHGTLRARPPSLAYGLCHGVVFQGNKGCVLLRQMAAGRLGWRIGVQPPARRTRVTPTRPLPSPPEQSRGPAAHARVGCQRPALAAPADLLQRPGPLPHGFRCRRPLLVWNRLVHLQQEGRERGAELPGGSRPGPALPRPAVLTIPAVHFSRPGDCENRTGQGPQSCRSRAPRPHVTCRHMTWSHVIWPTRDRMCGAAGRKLRCKLGERLRRLAAGQGQRI